MKRIAIIPTLCTLGNAVCGFGSIMCAARAGLAHDLRPEAAAYFSGLLIFLAMVFDVFDGYLARKSKTASNFGAELDSLCDAISFGAAPAFLLIQISGAFSQRLIQEVFLLIALLFMLCAVLRLARFNVQATLDVKSHRSFKGLPSPAAAGCLASLWLLRYNFSDNRFLPDVSLNPFIEWIAPLAALTVALLMVSRVPYLHVANRVLLRRQRFGRVVQLVLAAFAILLFRELALVLIFWGYAMSGPIRMLYRRLAHITIEEPSDEVPPHQEIRK